MDTPKQNSPPILLILGPTAGGKSDLAFNLANHFKTEIISADSMQIYQHLNAGTAKPSPSQRRQIKHHLIDHVHPTQPYTVADWLQDAEQIIQSLHKQNKLPIVVGGTNLYIKALLEGLFDGPSSDPAFRQTLDPLTSQQLHQKLLALDPAAAQRIHPNDRKRLIRALEVLHTTGKSITQHQTQWHEQPHNTPSEDSIESDNPTADPPSYNHNPISIALNWPVPVINQRINQRVKLMTRPDPETNTPDLLTETRKLLAQNLLGPQARQAIGTRQILDHLESRLTLDEAYERIKIDTRRFAKQQRTWLRRFKNLHWLSPQEHTPDSLQKSALAIIQNATPSANGA